MTRSPITTHVLDTAHGHPARGVPIVLEGVEEGTPSRPLGSGTTDDDGRVTDLLPPDHSLEPGLYRLRFDTAAYFTARDVTAFYPEVTITFHVRGPDEHYHVPLLLNPFGYSTYRGS